MPPRPPGPPPPPLKVENSRRFGSVQVSCAFGPMCGNARALISMMTPFVRLISSSARKISGFLCSAVKTACSSVKIGAPLSLQPRSLSPRLAARIAIGVADGEGERIGDALRVDGTDTVPASVGEMVALITGDGVDVDTSVGVEDGDSTGLGLELGDGVWL